MVSLGRIGSAEVGLLDVVLPIVLGAFLGILVSVMVGWGIDVQKIAEEHPAQTFLTLLVGFATGALVVYAYRFASIRYLGFKDKERMEEEISSLTRQRDELAKENEILHNQVLLNEGLDVRKIMSDISIVMGRESRRNHLVL